MTSQEQAYELAKKNGYAGRVYSKYGELLDPLFFQALGRGLGWDSQVEYYKCENEACVTEERWLTKSFCPDCGEKLYPVIVPTENWRQEHHRLIDWIDDGKSVEEFFKGIISNK